MLMKLSKRQLIAFELFYHFEYLVDEILHRFNLTNYKDEIYTHLTEKLVEGKLSFKELEKLSEEGFLEVAKNIDLWLTNTSHSSIGGWIRVVVKNKCNDIKKSVAYRNRQNTREISDEEYRLHEENPFTNNPNFVGDTIRIILEEIIMDIPEKEKQGLLQFYFSGLKYKEIEAELGIKNAGTYIKRALKKIKSELEKRNINYD